MNISGSQQARKGVLRSKVGRRIFLLFIFCALLPLGLLAFFSLRQVTTHLYRQAEQMLHQESKEVGMATYERFLLLETELKMIISGLASGPAKPFEALSAEVREAAWSFVVLQYSREDVRGQSLHPLDSLSPQEYRASRHSRQPDWRTLR